MNASNWNATDFFRQLTEQNHLAQQHQFRFCRVSGLDGFEEALHTMQSTTAFVCVSDLSQGFTALNNTPRTRRVKTVFLAIRTPIDDLAARQAALDTLQELFRQFMSVLILEETRLREQFIYLDPRITFHEIDRYFFSGCTCAFFEIAIDKYTNLVYNPDEWTGNAGVPTRIER